MASELTEKSCLEAELLLGYKCFQKKRFLEERIKKEQATKAELYRAYETERESKMFVSTNLPKAKVAYQRFCESEKQKAVKRHIADLEERKKYIQERIKENENNIKTCKTPFGAFTLGRFVPFLAIKDYKKKIKEDMVLLQKLEEEKTQEPQVQYISFETFLRSQYSKKDLIAEYEILYGEDLAKTQTAVAVVEKRIALAQDTIAAIEKIVQASLAKLTEIPAYYFKPDAVEKMLFFYVNKRADNIRDLINLYETTVFQEAVLRSLKEIAISVDRLAETVRGSFARLGLQLGVINESIRENTQVQRLNSQKLSEIKDENARHYLEMVGAIEEVEIIANTYVTTEVTVE